MSYFAKIDSNNIVTEIHSVDQDYINTGKLGEPSAWIETKTDGSIRKQYAGIGFTYDAVNDVFISRQRFPSWTLDDNFDWQAPIAKPDDGKQYDWDEAAQVWNEYVY